MKYGISNMIVSWVVRERRTKEQSVGHWLQVRLWIQRRTYSRCY